MKECSVFSIIYEDTKVFGVECGGVRVSVSTDYSKAESIMRKCNYYGVCPEHLADVVEDELYDYHDFTVDD